MAKQVTIFVVEEVEENIFWKLCRLNVGNEARVWALAIVDPGPIVCFLQDKLQGFALQNAQLQYIRGDF